VLDEIEKTPVNVHDNRPLIDIVIRDAAVIFDPFEHLEEESLAELKEAQQKVVLLSFSERLFFLPALSGSFLISLPGSRC
jgi:hypothetical protein